MTRSRLANTTRAPEFYSRQLVAVGRASASSRLGAASRRQAEEKQTAVFLRWQIVIIFLLIIASGIIYLVVVFPFLVQWTGQLNSSKYVAPDRSVRPQTPLFDTPSSYTNVAELTLTGYGTPSTQIQFILNGDDATKWRTPVAQNGEFSFILPLEEGENTLQAYSFDNAGHSSGETKEYRVVLDTKPPEIDLEAPENHQEFHGRTQQQITIKGHTEPGARIIVNSQGTRADVDGYFELSYRLQDGPNDLHIQASDNAENLTDIQIGVTFSP